MKMQNEVNSLHRLVWVLFVCVLSVCAHANEPSWIYTLPISTNPNYVYKITVGEGKNYDVAYTKAFARAVLETSWIISGVTVKVNDDLNQIEKNVTKSLESISKEVRIQMNKVCEYIERPNSTANVRIYVLWQVPADGNTEYIKFDQYDCK